MHSKNVGTFGELKVATYLSALGLPVFKEIGDLCKVDLITQHKNKYIGIQVKAITKVNGCYQFRTSKAGPNYRFRYTEDDCDAFALYCIDDDLIVWLKSSEMTSIDKTFYFCFRMNPTKNNQNYKIRWVQEYTDVQKFLAKFD